MMLPRAPDELLMPVNPLFIGFSIAVAAMLGMTPLGPMPAAPDLLALVLVFWTVHQPRRVGVGVSFLAGLVMDVHSGALLGQQALAYSLLAYFAIALHRRLLWFSLPGQALQILPLLIAAHLVSMGTRLLVGGMFPGWTVLIAPFAEALLWPLTAWLLLLPQRRAPASDQDRAL